MRGCNAKIEAAIGYAADARGQGVAYARLTGSRKRQLLRVTFAVSEDARPIERANGYAALTAVARSLRKRGILRVGIAINDAQFVDEILTRRDLPDGLILSYVRLRCALNSLASWSVRPGATDDLTQRARAEAALNLAA
jgi:hypothetical protein